MRISRCFLPLLLVATCTGAQPLKWDYDDFYRKNMLYLHPIVNYEFHPLWFQEWEDYLFAGSSIRLNFGSVTLTELLSDSRIVINHRLIDRLWFRFEDSWYASHHINREEKSKFVGLEQYLWRGLSIFCYGDLAFNKEEADILFGISVTDSSRNRFFRVAFLDEDHFYDEKNDMGGITSQRSLGITWALNQRFWRLKVFGEGRYSTGFERNYSDPERSPDVSFHGRRTNRAHLKLYYHTSQDGFLELSASTYDFSESKRYQNLEFDYDYANTVTTYNLRHVFMLKETNRIRLGSYYVRQEARSKQYRAYSYERREILPYLFFEMERRFGTVEFGYMATFSKWVYDAAQDADDYDRKSFVDKVKFGYSYAFTDKARIQLSVSHVPAIEDFGGGNAQFLLFF